MLNFNSRHLRIGLISLISFYFVYHAINGRYGILSLVQLQRSISKNEAQLKLLEAQHNRLQNQANLLKPGHISKDLLEEKARLLLNFSYKTDLVVLQDEQKNHTLSGTD